MIIGRKNKEKFKRGFEGKGGSGEKTKSMNRGKKSFYPKFGCTRSLKQKGTKNIIDGANGTIGFTILLRRVRARVSNSNTIFIKKN